MVRVEEVEGRERAIEHREKRVEEERSLMQSQVQLLQTELDARCEEVLAAKRDAGRRLAEVTQDLAERSEEAEAAARREEVVREEANQQRVRAEQLAERLREARNSEGKLEENFRAELAAQTRFEIFHFSYLMSLGTFSLTSECENNCTWSKDDNNDSGWQHCIKSTAKKAMPRRKS